ncbi:MAG: hypothetical protein LBD30_08520 [Verrucomicrobiales bacterium]|jgi:hypothetical protein|nr:hypothetical protein [Verrucomicrobiales bacterium]
MKNRVSRAEFFPSFNYPLLLAPVLFGLAMVICWGVDTPNGDDREIIFLMEKAAGGGLTVSDLAAQHNEHRIFLPRLVFMLIGWLTHLNIRALMFASWLVATATYLVYLIWLRRAADVTISGGSDQAWRLTLGVGVGFCVFNVVQVENILWGFQLAWYLLVFFTALSFYWFHRYCAGGQNFMLALTVTSGVAAAWCSAHGLMTLPVVFCVMILPGWGGVKIRLHAPLTVLAVAAAMIVLYLHGYVKPAHHPPLFGNTPGNIVNFFLSTLASPFCAGENWMSTALGLTVLCAGTAGIGWLFFKKQLAAYVFPLCLFVFAVGFCLLITAGRSGFGMWQAFASRYTTFASLAVIALALAALPLVKTITIWRPGKMTFISVAFALLALLALQNLGITKLKQHHRLRQYDRLLAMDYKNIPANVFKAANMFHTDTRYLEILERRRWSLFHWNSPSAPRPAEMQFEAVDIERRKQADGRMIWQCGTREPSLIMRLGAPLCLPPALSRAQIVVTFQNDIAGTMEFSCDYGAGFYETVSVYCPRTFDGADWVALPINIPSGGAVIRALRLSPPKGARFAILNLQVKPVR